jgi:hypothetical protein
VKKPPAVLSNTPFHRRIRFGGETGYHSGHAQVLAGYYDGSPQQIRTWLDDGKDVPNVIGVVSTTWVNRYGDLGAFARSAWR